MPNFFTSRIDYISFAAGLAILSFAVVLLLLRRLYKTATKLKSIELAHAQLRESTAQMLNTEKLTALGEMAGGIAHELNQPLNVTKIICQGVISDIRKDRFSLEELKKDLPEVVVQMNKMAEIIEHMRAFTSTREGMPKRA